MKLNAILMIAVALGTTPAFAMAKKQAGGALTNSIKVTSVDVKRENAMQGNWSGSASCSNGFTGTHAGNKIHVEVEGTGGDGSYHHTLIYQLSKSYNIPDSKAGEVVKTKGHNGSFKIELPGLKDDVPFVQQTLFLITRDGAGHSVTSSTTFTVSRPVILGVSSDPKSKELDCSERYLPYPSTAGVLSNGSTNNSTVQVKQGIEKIWENNKGWQFGVYISPLSFLGLGNLFTLNADYFSQTSKQTVETVEVTSEFALSPGDYMQVYVQPTRYVTAYDATLVDPCGATQKLDGAYLFQWWGFAYHLYPVNPFDKKGPPLDAIGAPVVNTCSKDLTPSSETPNGSSFSFRGTNL